MKMRTNVSIDESLLKTARSHGFILSALLEKAIRMELQSIREAEWKEANQDSLKKYSDYVAEKGVFSDGMRSF